MRAWRLHQFGSLDNLTLDDVPIPTPAAGEILLRVTHVGLNPADHYMALGQYPRPPKPPFELGRDGAGVVEQAAAGGRFKAGDRVFILRSELGVTQPGTLAEFVCVPEISLAPVPQGWSPAEAGGAGCTFLTAWRALADLAELRPGQTVLITGASGGVGTAAIPIVKGLGARAIALSRDADKRARLAELGADIVIDAAQPDWENAVKQALAGGRVDLVLENVGGEFFEKSLRIVACEGIVLVVGLLAGVQPRANLGLLIHKCIRVQGFSVGAYRPEAAQAAWAEVLDLLTKADERPIIDSTFPFTELKDAFSRLQAGPYGKVIIEF